MMRSTVDSFLTDTLKIDTAVKQTPRVGPWLSFTPFI